MIRLFETHHIRKTKELSEALWSFTALDKEDAETLKVYVPSCWETYPGYENYKGTAMYETTFEAKGNIVLEFKGVSHYAKVYVDGKLYGTHYGSYTPFQVVVTGLDGGEHQLSVDVDNRYLDKYSLDFPNDYMSYGGISRGVVLHEVSECYVERIWMTQKKNKDGKWEVSTDIWVNNLGTEDKTIDIDVTLAGKTHTIKGCQLPKETTTKITEGRIVVEDAICWEVTNPKLYYVTVALKDNGKIIDDYRDRFGFRTVAVLGDKLLINDEPVYIKGVCRHEDYSGFGCALPAEAMSRDLHMIKDMGANSVRTTHYPNNEIFLDLCDELGILVWEESHARAIEEDRMKSPYFESQSEEVIEEMILNHYNHPSIYIWGILNECGSESEHGRVCYEAQYNLIRRMDKSRPHSSASCKFDADICQDLPDICSWNIYPYWYDADTATEKLNHVYQWLQGEGNGKGKPFMITEVGAGAIYGFHDYARDKWSEEYQRDILEKQLQEIAAFEPCIGMYIWQFSDVRVAKEWAITRPKSRNNKGIVDEFRRPKLAYDSVKAIFRGINK